MNAPDPLRRLGFRALYAAPRRLRWATARRLGKQPARWVQSCHTADDGADYTLRGMRDRHCIFVHVPKCAGISVTKTLFGNFGGGHASVADYLGVFGSDWFDRAFKFTFVRDPWTRTVSAFEFLRGGGLNRWDAAFGERYLKPYPDINAFVAERLGDPEVMAYFHFRDQVSFLEDPRTGGLGVDFIGRFESIDADFAAVCARFGVQAPLVMSNARAEKPGDDGLSAASVERIAEVYHRDVELLGYERLVLKDSLPNSGFGA